MTARIREINWGLSRGTISDRLKFVSGCGILSEPEVDISTGQVREFYKAPK